MQVIDKAQFQFGLLAPELTVVIFGFIILLIGAYSERSDNRPFAGLLAASGLAIAAVSKNPSKVGHSCSRVLPGVGAQIFRRRLRRRV